MSKGRGIALILSVLLASILGVVVVACSSAPPPKSSPSPNPSPSVFTPVQAVTPPDNPVKDWADGGGMSDIQTLESDFQSISNDASAGSMSAVYSDCQQLGTDAASMQSYEPFPDAVAATEISDALVDFVNAAGSCQSGVQNQDATEIDTATSELQAGTAYINEAASTIRADLG